MQVNVRKSHSLSGSRVFKAHVVEVNGAVRYLVNGVLRIAEGAVLVKHLNYSLAGFKRHGYHNENHGYHHQAHQYHKAVGQQSAELSHVKVYALCSNNSVGTERQHKHHN